jgi:hypothetical protein
MRKFKAECDKTRDSYWKYKCEMKIPFATRKAESSLIRIQAGYVPQSA